MFQGLLPSEMALTLSMEYGSPKAILVTTLLSAVRLTIHNKVTWNNLGVRREEEVREKS